MKGVLDTVDTRASHSIRFCTNNIGHRDGKIDGPTSVHEAMLTGEDKVECWTEIHPKHYLPTTIFIGDGAMDLPCMMAAMSAVVITRDPSKSYPYRALQRMGSEVPHVSMVKAGWQFCHAEDFCDLTDLMKAERKWNV